MVSEHLGRGGHDEAAPPVAPPARRRDARRARFRGVGLGREGRGDAAGRRSRRGPAPRGDEELREPPRSHRRRRGAHPLRGRGLRLPRRQIPRGREQLLRPGALGSAHDAGAPPGLAVVPGRGAVRDRELPDVRRRVRGHRGGGAAAPVLRRRRPSPARDSTASCATRSASKRSTGSTSRRARCPRRTS